MQEFRPGRFEVLPVVIKNLLIINGIFFLAQNTLGGKLHFSMDDIFALHAWESPLFQPWQLITHMFMHGGFGHIFGNMFALWMFGAVLENLWGPKRFLTFYIICGLGAAFLHMLILHYEIGSLTKDYLSLYSLHRTGSSNFVPNLLQYIASNNVPINPEAITVLQQNPLDTEFANKVFKVVSDVYTTTLNTPTIGASGAVFGVLAAFIYLFPNTYIYLYFFIPVKAKWLGLVYFGVEVFYALQNSAGDNVARWAHIGGALVGFLVVISWNKTNKKTFY
jgi:membrane associated rhomboid family serine protease